jgi:hypothetical protein
MGRNRSGLIAIFFEKLLEGDPVALGILASFIVFLVIVGLTILKVRRDHRLEDEERDRRRSYKSK